MTEFTPPDALDENGECFFFCLSPAMGFAHHLAMAMANVMVRISAMQDEDARRIVKPAMPIHYRYAPSKGVLLEIIAEAGLDENWVYVAPDADGKPIAVFIGPMVGDWPKDWWAKTRATADITLIDNAINCTIEGENRVDTQEHVYQTDIGLNGKPIRVTTTLKPEDFENQPKYARPRYVAEQVVDGIAKKLAVEIFAPIFEATQRIHGRKF